MTASNYDLAVAYRIYSKVSKVPPVFGDNKLKLAELCLRSFKNSLGSLRVKIWVLLDNCPSEYEELFKKYFDINDLEIIKLPGIGNRGTLKKQIHILSEQNVSKIVYFAEDDYFYMPNQFETMVNFIRNSKDVDFLSPYDNPDYYNLDLHRYSSKIKIFGNRHWRSVSCTTVTFLTSRENLRKVKNVIGTYSKKTTYTKGNYDSSYWMSLTKYKVFNLFALIKYLVLGDRNFFRIAKAWFFCWWQILFGKRWKLWVPTPSIATHMESNGLAPNIDWLKLMDQEIDEMNQERAGKL